MGCFPSTQRIQAPRPEDSTLSGFDHHSSSTPAAADVNGRQAAVASPPPAPSTTSTDSPEQPGTPGADDQLSLPPGQLGGEGPGGGAAPAGTHAGPPILPIPPAAESARDAPSSEGREVEAAEEESRGAPAAAAPVVLPTAADLLAQLDSRKLVLIVWDIENVRLPFETCSELSPANVIKYVKDHFHAGRTEYRTVAAVTPGSLGPIQGIHPTFVDEVSRNMTLLLASTDNKRNADVVLKKEIDDFVREYGPLARLRPGHLTVVLLSGDEDFLGSVQDAMRAGFNVELVAHTNSASTMLSTQGFAKSWRHWLEFLRDESGVDNVQLPSTGHQHPQRLPPMDNRPATPPRANGGGGGQSRQGSPAGRRYRGNQVVPR